MAEARNLDEKTFLSICLFPEGKTDPDDLSVLRDFCLKITNEYAYWEVVIVSTIQNRSAFDEFLQVVPNLRVLFVRSNLSVYQRRVVGATEAIGDIVALTSFDELSSVNILELVKKAKMKECIVGARSKRLTLFSSVLKPLGRLSGFYVDENILKTQVLPRTQINELLQHTSADLALRFPPRDADVLFEFSDAKKSKRRVIRGIGRRLEILQQLLINTAPMVLIAVSLISLLVFFSGIAFAFYVLFVWATFETIAPGWITSNLLLSLTGGLLGAVMFGLSIALHRIIDLLTPKASELMLLERSRIDLYDSVFARLNVEMDTETVEKSPAFTPQEKSANKIEE